MTGAQIRKCLHDGRRVYGTHISSLMNSMATSIAGKLEMDFAFFCTEHMPLDRSEIGRMCQFYASCGISPIVRIPTMDTSAISMAMDAGAQGIVVPYVETTDEVMAAVGAVRYRPVKGQLLKDVLSGQKKLNVKTMEFLEDFNRDNYLIIGIESVPAIENLPQILEIDGVDGIFLGPHDITVSMGIPTEYDHPNFVDTVENIILQCRNANVGVGLHTNYLKLPNDTLLRFLDAGMNWLINGADITLMCDAMNTELKKLRQIAGDWHSYIEPNTKIHDKVKSCLV